ncbi:MAG: WXG100 family type VII secretion target [Anaerolinea sp.]|nr:WXG100 family type VII secretion target [Anaerolinea sp.]
MSAPVIQAQYDQLEQVAVRFGRQAEAAAQTTQRVQQSMRALQAGGWEGRGAAAFFNEMDGAALPALHRLSTALQQAQTVTRQIVQVLRTAEEEAARPFRGAGAAGASGGGASGQAASGGPPFGDYANLRDIPPLVLGPGATYQDLAAMIEQMYRINDVRDGRPYGVDEPVKIVRIGANQYLVAIIGTDAGGDGHTGPNDWLANLSSGRGVPSRFQLEAKRLIEQHVPPGATIHLAGHSQGGHVAMNLAGTQGLSDRYQIGSVNTIGSSGSSTINPRIGAENYHNFVLADDPIRLIERSAPRIPFTNLTWPVSMGSSLSWLGVTGSGGSPSIDPQVIWETGGHGGYVQSPAMASRPLPFSIERWEVVGSYQVHSYDNYSTAWQTISNGWSQGNAGQVAWGGVDFMTHLGTTTTVAVAQNMANTATQYLPTDWQVAIDRQFDAAGQYVANAPRPSQWLPAVVNTVWSGFWE